MSATLSAVTDPVGAVRAWLALQEDVAEVLHTALLASGEVAYLLRFRGERGPNPLALEVGRVHPEDLGARVSRWFRVSQTEEALEHWTRNYGAVAAPERDRMDLRDSRDGTD